MTDSDLDQIKKSLAHIESLLQRMPEIQAAVFLQMKEELGPFGEFKASEVWTVCPANQR